MLKSKLMIILLIVFTFIGISGSGLASNYLTNINFVQYEAPILYKNSFSDSLDSNVWEKGDIADWTIVDGKLYTNGKNRGRLDFLKQQFNDFKIQFDISISGPKWSGVQLRKKNPQDKWDSGYFIIIFSDGTIRVLRRTPDGLEKIEVASTGINFSNSRRVRIKIKNYNIKVLVEGKEVINVTDDKSSFSSGYFSLWNMEDNVVKFDDLVVLDLQSQ